METQTAKQRLDVELGVKGASVAEAEFSHFVNSASKAGEKSGKSFISQLNAQFGKRSDLAKWTKLLMGGGAIAGLNMVFSSVANVAKEVRHEIDGLSKGTANWATVTEKALLHIPVLGEAYKATLAITGQKTADEQREAAQKALEYAMQTGAMISDTGARLKLLGTTGTNRQRIEAENAYRKQLAEIKQQRMKTRDEMAYAPASQQEMYQSRLSQLDRMAALADKERLQRLKEIKRTEDDFVEAEMSRLVNLRDENNIARLRITSNEDYIALQEIEVKLQRELYDLGIKAAKEKRGETDTRKADIDRTLKAEFAARRDSAQIARDAIKKRREDRDREQAEKLAEHRKDVAREIEGSKMFLAEQKGGEGDVAARLQAEIMRIEAEYKPQIEKLQDVLLDVTASTLQKRQARAMLGQLEPEMRKRMERAKVIEPVEFAGFADSRFMTGAAARAREEGRNITPAQKTADNTATMANLMQQLLPLIAQAIKDQSSNPTLTVKGLN